MIFDLPFYYWVRRSTLVRKKWTIIQNNVYWWKDTARKKINVFGVYSVWCLLRWNSHIVSYSSSCSESCWRGRGISSWSQHCSCSFPQSHVGWHCLSSTTSHSCFSWNTMEVFLMLGRWSLFVLFSVWNKLHPFY